MSQNDFTTTMVVDQTPHEVYTAINNVRAWWSGEIEGSTDTLNEEFTYRHGESHYSRQKVVELVPDTRVVWLVTDSAINFVQDRGEWTGTHVRFDISRQGDKTRLDFTHEGLVPTLECYNDCKPGWLYYVSEGLQPLITTGKSHAEQVVS
jgi:activator of Hsp90 ATPase-like protein